jgi:4-hydroxy-tetrahydrodipicolinate reductase
MSDLPVAVVGAQGRLGAFACATVEAGDGLALVARYDQGDDWPSAIGSSGAAVAFEATRAGLGLEHGLALLEAGLRPVIGTSGVDAEQNARLDARARELGLGGLVVPNFSLGIALLRRAAADFAAHFPSAEVIDLHHERKLDAPSGTGAELARTIAAARDAPEDEVPIHSVRMPGLYAHHEVLFGAPGERLTLRHDMSGPEAFAPGIVCALRYAATAEGVGRGIELALGRA